MSTAQTVAMPFGRYRVGDDPEANESFGPLFPDAATAEAFCRAVDRQWELGTNLPPCDADAYDAWAAQGAEVNRLWALSTQASVR